MPSAPLPAEGVRIHHHEAVAVGERVERAAAPRLQIGAATVQAVEHEN